MIYLDTSLIVSLLTSEPTTAGVTQWYARQSEPLVSADWCVVEFASAIALKQRAKQLRPVHARKAHEAFEILVAGGLRLLPVSRSAFQQAAVLSKSSTDGLRSGDALHLAVALEIGATTLAGLDAVMNTSAKKQGMHIAQI